MKKFRNVISLGFFCSSALEIERIGYRSFSSPFDWLITNDFEKVLQLIDNGFKGFLDEGNLEQEQTDPKFYYDKVNDIHFFHDFVANKSLQEQIIDVRAKYNRRISRFYETIRQPCLFIRYCSSRQELEFIQENNEWVHNIISNYNENNEIIFICNSDIATGQFIDGGGYFVEKDLNDTVARFFLRKNPSIKKFIIDNVHNNIVIRVRNIVLCYKKKIMKRIKRL